MDYSLLLGVHFSKPTIGPQENKLLKENGHRLLVTTTTAATEANAKDEYPLMWDKDR
jgi:hypothetical protein